MIKKILIAGATGAAILGVGVTALATTGSGSATTGAKTHHRAGALKRVEHGEFVTKVKGQQVTRDIIRGTVTAVSGTAVTVKADDGYVLTYAVGSTTKVVQRAGGKGSAKKGAIADVKTGDKVAVAGTKSGSTRTANHVVDLGTK